MGSRRHVLLVVVAVSTALAILGCSRPAAQTGASASVEVIQTSTDLSQRLTRMPDVRFRAGTVRGVQVIHVNESTQYQRMVGFGAALTDTSAWLLYAQLPPAARNAAFNALFGATGIGLNFLRVPIGATDYVVGGVPYTYDDLPPHQTDPALARFSIAHDEGYVLPALRQILAVNPHVELLASPWTPPAWMKANQSLSNFQKRGTLLRTAYGPLARYLVKFIQSYARAGVPIQALTPQNEPALGTKYPGMTLAASDEARFITRYLKPALRSAGLHVGIYGFDFNWFLTSYPKALISDPLVLRAISGLSWHCYVGNPEVMTTLHRLAPTLQQLETECSTGLAPEPPAELAIASARNWASTVTLWNLALDNNKGPHLPVSGCTGCTGVVTVDKRAGTVTYRLDYYQLGQVSSFVQRGARRIGSDHFVNYRFAFETHDGGFATAGVDDVAFKNPDGSKVLVAYNNASHSSRFAVAWRGRSFSYTLPAQATVTFVWR